MIHRRVVAVATGAVLAVVGAMTLEDDQGFINGWIGARSIYGRLLRVEP